MDASLASSKSLSSERPCCSRQLSRNTPLLQVPSLPKLHGRGPLVTTTLSESIYKSTAGHVFDLSNSKEYESFTEYNSLHDPHTKAYFNRPPMIRKLQNGGFVTEELKVTCSLKEYNAYRNFLEREFMKIRKTQEEMQEKEKQKVAVGTQKPAQRTVDQEREEKRKRFFEEQEWKLHNKQRQMRRMQRREQMAKKKAMEERRMMREKNEIRREAEREQRRLVKLQREHQEALEKKRLLHYNENQDLARMVHLHQSIQNQRRKHIEELESKWKAYDEHAQRVKEEEEERKAKAKEEKEKRKRRREKLIKIFQAKEEERKRRLHEENMHQVEVLKEQADQLEKKWRQRKESQVVLWREKIHREQEHWKYHIDHQMEACKHEHQRQIESILHSSHLPKCATSNSNHKHIGSISSKCSASVAEQPQKKKEAFVKVAAVPPVKKGVHFFETPSVHIIEECDDDDEDMQGEEYEPETKSPLPELQAQAQHTEGTNHYDDEAEDNQHSLATKELSTESLKMVASGLVDNVITKAQQRVASPQLTHND